MCCCGHLIADVRCLVLSLLCVKNFCFVLTSRFLHIQGWRNVSNSICVISTKGLRV
jgi:hypothetical protein